MLVCVCVCVRERERERERERWEDEEENKVFVTVALAVLWKEASGNWRAVPLVTKRMLGSGYFCLHPACSHLHIFHLQYSAESALTRSSRILSSCCKIQWPV